MVALITPVAGRQLGERQRAGVAARHAQDRGVVAVWLTRPVKLMFAVPPSNVSESPVVLVIVASVSVMTPAESLTTLTAGAGAHQAHVVVERVHAVGVVELQAVAGRGVDHAGAGGELGERQVAVVAARRR